MTITNKQVVNFYAPEKKSKPKPKSKEELEFYKIFGFFPNQGQLEKATVEIKRWKRGQKFS